MSAKKLRMEITGDPRKSVVWTEVGASFPDSRSTTLIRIIFPRPITVAPGEKFIVEAEERPAPGQPDWLSQALNEGDGTYRP